MKKTLQGLGFIVPTLFLLVTMSTPAAFADTVTLTLDTATSLSNPPFGTVQLTLNNSVSVGDHSADNSIQFDVKINNSGHVIQTGQDAGIAFNSSISTDPTITYQLISASGGDGASFTLENSGVPTHVPTQGMIHMDGAGYFEYGITGPDPTGASSEVVFKINKTGGFTSVTQLVANSISGSYASPIAVDIYENGFTGIVGSTGGGGGTQSVPEPSSLILLGMGLVFLGGSASSRLRRK